MKLSKASLKTRFRGVFLISLCLLGGFFSLLFFGLFRWNEGDAKFYRKLIKESSAEEESLTFTTKQRNAGMQKEIIFTKKNERLQFRLSSSEAELVLDRQEKQNALVEHMKDVVCDMQEEIYYILSDGRKASMDENGRLLIKGSPLQDPIDLGASEVQPMQVICHLEADYATYHYQEDKFFAENVKVSRYILPGKKIDSSFRSVPLMSGIAKSVEFSLRSKEPNFKASHMTSKFYLKGEVL